MATIEVLNSVALQWGTFMWHRMVDSTWVLLIAVLLWGLIRHRVSAQFGYCLFLLVLLKLVIPIQAPLPNKAARLLSTPLMPVWQHVNRPVGSASLLTAEELKSNETIELAAQKKEPNPAEKDQRRHGMTLSMSALLMMGWLTVLLVLLLRFAYTEWHTLQLIAQSCPVDLESMGISSNEITAAGNLTRPIRVVANPNVTSPCVYGLFSPVLLLPTNLTNSYTGSQIRWMLLHELAHIRRRDTLVKLFQKIMHYVFFFHPAVWIANAMIDRQREFACDDIAMLESNLSHTDCGEHFFHIITKLSQNRIFVPSVLGLWSPKHVIRNRLMRMLDLNHIHQTKLSTRAFVCLALVALLVLPFSGIQANQAIAAEPVDTIAAIEPGTVTFPADDYIQDKNYYIWTQALSAEAAGIQTVYCFSQDGDINITSHVDNNKNIVDVEAHIMIAPNAKVEITPELEQAILALKENVGVIVERHEKPLPGQEPCITVQTVIPKQKPEGLNVSIDMDITLPARLALTVKSQDGDINIQGPIGTTSLVTLDGDVTVSDCLDALLIKSQDGDIDVNNCAGALSIETKDGDTSASLCQDAVSIKSQDGEVAVNDCTGPLILKLQDGDVMVQNCREAIDIKVQDGDVMLKEVSAKINVATKDGDILIETHTSWEDDCLLQSRDGDILLTLPETSNLNLDLNTGDGEILLNSSRFTGTKTEHKAVGKLNNGGPNVKAQTRDGDLAVQFK